MRIATGRVLGKKKQCCFIYLLFMERNKKHNVMSLVQFVLYIQVYIRYAIIYIPKVPIEVLGEKKQCCFIYQLFMERNKKHNVMSLVQFVLYIQVYIRYAIIYIPKKKQCCFIYQLFMERNKKHNVMSLVQFVLYIQVEPAEQWSKKCSRLRPLS